MTTQTKWTPGPWRVSTEMRGIGNRKVDGVETAGGQSIANCGVDSEANARLIAAAPELAEALAAYLEVIEAIGSGGCISAEHMEDKAARLLDTVDARALLARLGAV